MTTQLKLSLLFLFIFQVAISMSFGLAHDEAYYWLFSRHLDWAYFDHPPFMAVVIRLFSFLGHSEFAVRFGFIILQFLTSFIVLRMVPEKNRTRALFLFFAFPLASIGGMLALPDMPLLFMTAVYVWGLKNYLEKDDLQNSLTMGAVIALLFYAKYHGVLLVFFTMLAVPKLLLRKSFYLIALVALIMFFPHLWWQYEHHFSTLRYHFLERPTSSFSVKRTSEYLFLQIILAGLLAGPIVWWTVLREKNPDLFFRSLKFISLGTVIFFFLSSFSKKVEANWTIFLAVPLIILTMKSAIWENKWARNLLYISSAICLLARIIFVFNQNQLPVKRLGEFKGWNEWAHDVARQCESRVIMANSYQIAAKLSFYLDQDIPALNFHSRKNQFDFWRFDLPNQDKPICYVTDKSIFSGDVTVTPEKRELKIVKFDSLPMELRKPVGQ